MSDRNPTLTNQHPGVIFVASDSRPVDVGGSIAHRFRQQGSATVQAIGPIAVNQAVKAVICATRYLALEDKAIGFLPSFYPVVINARERTAIRFEIVTAVSAEPCDKQAT